MYWRKTDVIKPFGFFHNVAANQPASHSASVTTASLNG
ncbi:hypothetical protein F652_2822 [Enterobacteriaceae bacterium bta3-1]|nr:hypothetical protein F652_2822 [Enterobacteriaceae bacterium bta3-1]